MSLPIRSMLLVGFVMLLTSLPAVAASPDTERIKQLEQENDALRQELAQLRLQVSQLKRELQKHQADVENQNDETEKSADMIEKEVEKKEDENKSRKFRSADEIYRAIPQDMRPARDGWDIVEKQTVGDWLKTNVTGKPFESRKKISQTQIRYDSINRIWEVRLSFEYEKMRYMSWDMQERLNGVVLRGDKAFAENARKKYKTGSTVNVSGTIARIHWDLLAAQNPEKNWHPTHCTLSLDGVQIK